MRTLIEIYMAINIFMAGAWWVDTSDEQAWKKIINTIALMFIGIPFVLCSFVPDVLKWIDGIFQIRFWAALLFTSRFDKIDIDKLEDAKKAIPYRNWFYKKAINVLIRRVGGN